MSKFSRGAGRGKAPHGRTNERRNGMASKSILVCQGCRCYFFKKAWHHRVDANRSGFRLTDSVQSKAVTCPACQMVRERQYAGRVRIENVPGRMTSELANLIHSYGRKSYLRDPQDRLVSVRQQGDTMEVTMTDNQLAVRLAKKIKEVFSKVTLAISHSGEQYESQFARLRFI